MQILILLTLLSSCSSFFNLDQKNSEDTHSSKKISYHQMGLEFNNKEKRLGLENEEKLNQLSQKIISTSQPIKKITIFSNPKNEKMLPKQELINFDRAFNAKRYLEKDLHTQGEIEIQDKKSSPHNYKKNADLLILIEYL